MATLRTALLATLIAAGMTGLLAGDAATVGAARPVGEGSHRARLDRSQMAVPARSVGHRPRISLRRAPIAVSRSMSTCAPRSASAIARPAFPTMPSLTASATSNSSASKFHGLAAGRPIAVGWMNGRSRAYNVAIPYGQPRDVLAMAFNDQCDVMVATVVAERDQIAAAERHALEFLNGELVLRWAKAELGNRHESRRPGLSRHQPRARHGARAQARFPAASRPWFGMPIPRCRRAPISW